MFCIWNINNWKFSVFLTFKRIWSNYMKSATIMTRNSVSDHPENIYEMRKLNEGLNTSRRSHIQGEGQGMAKKVSVIRNNSTHVAKSRHI
jgi:hypothetical protein